MKHKKRKTLIALILLFLLMMAAGILQSMVRLSSITVGSPDIRSVRDGSYEGSYETGLVNAAVSVKVKDGRLESIILLKHDNGRGEKAEAVLSKILEKQSLEVDNISGATLSSLVLRKSVEEALLQGGIK